MPFPPQPRFSRVRFFLLLLSRWLVEGGLFYLKSPRAHISSDFLLFVSTFSRATKCSVPMRRSIIKHDERSGSSCSSHVLMVFSIDATRGKRALIWHFLNSRKRDWWIPWLKREILWTKVGHLVMQSETCKPN